MKIEVKSVPLTKSKIKQMNYIGVPKDSLAEVLGWVNIDKERYVIVKIHDCYYRAEFITELQKEIKSVQFPSNDGGWEFPMLHNIKCTTYNRGVFSYSPERNDELNLKLYEHLISFKRKTEMAGQIYY